jgi:hypothetical protein
MSNETRLRFKRPLVKSQRLARTRQFKSPDQEKKMTHESSCPDHGSFESSDVSRDWRFFGDSHLHVRALLSDGFSVALNVRD